MRTRTILVSAVAAVAATALAASPALADPTDTTDTTFEVEAGTLDVTTPATADLGTGAPGDTISGQLGVVTVSDTRAADDASWEATVTSTDFTTGGATASETVPATAIDYWSGPATATTGNGTFTPGQATAGAAEPLDNTTGVVAFTHTGGTGNNTAAWNPTLDVNVPLANQAGTYTGTVTHSVA
ncbi:hypothetical protein ACQPYA_28865 [Micromonospora sp. CA-263727]|uniref:hypothetical protein n=1 Tax=Micromonospora sp. CA-263727 TaxID=3239967 RepID=UPI003D8E8607